MADKDLEDERLMHVAAGTDIPTAFAVLPQNEPTPAGQNQRASIVCAVLVGVAVVLWVLAG